MLMKMLKKENKLGKRHSFSRILRFTQFLTTFCHFFFLHSSFLLMVFFFTYKELSTMNNIEKQIAIQNQYEKTQRAFAAQTKNEDTVRNRNAFNASTINNNHHLTNSLSTSPSLLKLNQALPQLLQATNLFNPIHKFTFLL